MIAELCTTTGKTRGKENPVESNTNKHYSITFSLASTCDFFLVVSIISEIKISSLPVPVIINM